MSVTRIHEDPRVTKPYTDEQWQAILALGDRVDARARRRRRAADDGRRADVRLDRRHGRRGVEHRGHGPDQAAAGRRRCSAACATRSRPAACCTSGRASGIRASRCRAGPSPATGAPTACRSGAIPRSSATRIATTASAPTTRSAFAEALAERLSVGPRVRHRRLRRPARLHPQGAAASGQRRSRATTSSTIPKSASGCAASSAAASARPTGFVLPLARVPGKDGPTWQSGLWMLRARHLFLMPGDSPVGFRLPLESLPAGPACEVVPVDPMAPREPLGPGASATPLRVRAGARTAPAGAGRDRTAAAAACRSRRCRSRRTRRSPYVRTALSVEARDGTLWTFLPPVAVGRGLRRAGRRDRRHRRRARHAGAGRRLSAAVRSAAAVRSRSRPTPA